MHKYTASQYIDDVLSGKQIACKWVKLAVQRHVKDLERIGDKQFPYYFDEDAAKRIIDFIQLLKHSKGEWAGTYIKLEPWQQFQLWVLFGWKRQDGTRRFRKAYIEVARKNAKTTIGAAIGNYCFIADNEPGAECYTAATKRDQARISHSESSRQVKGSQALRKKIRNFKDNMSITETAAKYVPLGADSKTEDGLNPHFALIDEYHAHPSDSLVNVLQSGMGSRSQPLLYIITTAGFEKNCACYKEHERAENVLEGSADPMPDDYFCILYTLNEGDDWTDENVWVKSNPNLDVSVYKRFIRDQVREALDSPSMQNNVKTKNLNIWTQAVTRWILHEKWRACSFPVDAEGLRGRSCYGGLDLSTSVDITAYVLCFPPQTKEDKYKFIYRFFIPEENIVERERKDRVPYRHWIQQGFVIATPGDVIDDVYIEDLIREDAEKYDIKEIAYDPWNANPITNHLTADGMTMVQINQRYASMSPATKDFEKKVLSREIATGGNPVMDWMISCTEVKSDRQGNIMPMKPERDKSGKRIDGVISSIMALNRAVIHTEPEVQVKVYTL